jgi:hypothetical protein
MFIPPEKADTREKDGNKALPDTRSGSRSRKKWVVFFVTPALVFILAAVLLSGFAGRIVKNRLEKHFGDRFKVEDIAVGWGSIKAKKVQILSEGHPVLTAQAVQIRPDWLSLFRKGFSISGLAVDGVVFRIELDRTGSLILPVPLKTLRKALLLLSRIGIHTLDQTVIRGTIFFKARHLSGLNELKAEEVRIEILGLAHPIRNHPVQFTARANLSGPLASGKVDLNSSINFFQKRFSFALAGDNLSLFNEEPHGPFLQAASFRLSGSSEKIAGRQQIISDLTMTGPRVRLVIDSKGRLASPFPKKMKPIPGKEEKKDPTRFYLLRNIRIIDGRFLFLDGKISRPPHSLEVTNIAGQVHQMSYPFQDAWADYKVSGQIPAPGSPGRIEISGKTNPKTADHLTEVQLRNVALSQLRPYIQKQGDARITGGTCDINMHLTIEGRRLHAPTQVVLKDLTFAPAAGVTDLFVGVPRKMVLGLLKNNRNQIVLDLVVKGSIDKPTFSLRENLLKRVTVGLAKRLGLSVVEISEKVIVEGIETIKGLGEDAGQGLERLFK